MYIALCIEQKSNSFKIQYLKVHGMLDSLWVCYGIQYTRYDLLGIEGLEAANTQNRLGIQKLRVGHIWTFGRWRQRLKRLHKIFQINIIHNADKIFSDKTYGAGQL